MTLNSNTDGVVPTNEIVLDAPIAPTDGGSDIQRRAVLEQRDADVNYVKHYVSAAIDAFFRRYVLANLRIRVLPEQVSEDSLTVREMIILRAQVTKAMRALLGGPTKNIVNIDDVKAQLAQWISEGFVDHELRLQQHGIRHFDPEMIATTTDTIMQSIIEHPDMSAQGIIKGFLGGKS